MPGLNTHTLKAFTRVAAKLDNAMSQISKSVPVDARGRPESNPAPSRHFAVPNKQQPEQDQEGGCPLAVLQMRGSRSDGADQKVASIRELQLEKEKRRRIQGTRQAATVVSNRRSSDVAGSSRSDQSDGVTPIASVDIGDVLSMKNDSLDPATESVQVWPMTSMQIAKARKREAQAAQITHLRTIWPAWRITCLKMSRTHAFKALSMLIIVVNAAVMVVEANHPPNTFSWVQLASNVCTVLFAIDFGIRAAGCTLDHWFHSGWLVLDAVIITAALFEIIMKPFVATSEKNLRLLRTFQLLRLMRLFRLGRIFGFWRPLRVILRAIGKAWHNVLAVCVFIGLQWITFAIMATSCLGHQALKEEEGDELRETMQRYFGTVPRSFLTCLETTVGGVEWGEILLYPLFLHENRYYTVCGIFLLISILYSTFCLWNLVLGIYVRQVITIAKDYDQEMEHQDLLSGEGKVHDMRELLDMVDTNKDGYISTEEMRIGIMQSEEALEKLGIGAEEVEVLHAALDTESTGQVGTSELLFGVLKLAGTSKTIDMLSIDYRQKVFLRDITSLERASARELGKLNGALDKVVDNTLKLQREMNDLRAGIDQAKEDLLDEITCEDGHVEEAERQASELAALDEARRHERNHEAREAIEEHLKSLRGQVDEIAQVKLLESLCAGNRADAARLKAAVRRRLETQLGPWLERELIEAGGVR